MKKIIALIAIVVSTGTFVMAQPPKPAAGNVTTTDQKTVENTNQGPVGTATALLVTLGAGAVAYKVRKNKKQEN